MVSLETVRGKLSRRSRPAIWSGAPAVLECCLDLREERQVLHPLRTRGEGGAAPLPRADIRDVPVYRRVGPVLFRRNSRQTVD